MIRPRVDNRAADVLRPTTITRDFIPQADGSCLITCGNTRVVCTASIEETQPPWLRGQDQGWLTAEYGMLPRATRERTPREAVRGKQSGRTQEIQRLIGRCLRAVINLKLLGKRTIHIDCDVIQADGGTRTASITGGFVALAAACAKLSLPGLLHDSVAAISCGLLDGIALLDLDYHEDAACTTDMNFVMTGQEQFVELQGTAEGAPFTRQALDEMSQLAAIGIRELSMIQRSALGEAMP